MSRVVKTNPYSETHAQTRQVKKNCARNFSGGRRDLGGGNLCCLNPFFPRPSCEEEKKRVSEKEDEVRKLRVVGRNRGRRSRKPFYAKGRLGCKMKAFHQTDAVHTKSLLPYSVLYVCAHHYSVPYCICVQASISSNKKAKAKKHLFRSFVRPCLPSSSASFFPLFLALICYTTFVRRASFPSPPQPLLASS